MGVSWVLEVKENMRSVELAYERAGAVPNDNYKNFKVDCTWYQPANLQISGFYVMHHTYYPESSFIISTGNEHDPTILRSARGTADLGFDLILAKLKDGFFPEATSRCELNGSEYRLRDFRLRVGTLSMGTAVKGVVAEVEYAASNIVQQCIGILEETVDIFFPGYAEHRQEILTQTAYPDNYYPIETMNQYLNVFLSMRSN